MINIIKSQFYQIKRSSFLWISTIGFFIVIILCAVMSALSYETSMGAPLTGSGLIADYFRAITSMAGIYIFIFASKVCAEDFSDKTINYELMCGHTRRQVFWGRVLIELIAGIFIYILLVISPVILISALNGFGGALKLSDVILRIILLIFPAIRLMCEIAFLSFVFKNPYIIMGIGYLTFIITVTDILEDSVWMSFTNISLISSFDAYATYGLGESVNLIYESSLEPSAIIGTIISSVAFSVIFLLMSYAFFKKDDIE